MWLDVSLLAEDVYLNLWECVSVEAEQEWFVRCTLQVYLLFRCTCSCFFPCMSIFYCSVNVSVLGGCEVAAMKVVEVFVLPNVHGSFSGLVTCQVPVLHGRYDATQLWSVPIIFIPACSRSWSSHGIFRRVDFFPPPIVGLKNLIVDCCVWFYNASTRIRTMFIKYEWYVCCRILVLCLLYSVVIM